MDRRGLDRAEKQFAILFFFVALGFGGRMALVTFNGPLVGLFTDNGYLIGLLLAVGPLVATFAHPLFGRLSDRTSTRFGRRIPYALVGVPLSSIVVLFIPLAPDYAALLGLFFLQALLVSVCGVPLMSLIPDVVGTAARGRVMSLFMIGGGIGAIAIQAGGKVFWDYDFGLVYYATGALTLIFAVPPLFFIREPKEYRAEVHEARARGGLSMAVMLAAVARRRPIALFLVSASLRYLGVGLVITYLTLFAATDLDISVGDAALAVAVSGLIRLALAVPTGRLVDAYDRKRLLIIATWMAAGAHLLTGLVVQNLWHLYVVLAAGAVAGVLEMTAGGPLFMDLMPAVRRGELTGINMVLQNVLRAVGALLGGALFAWTDGYRVLFPVAAACFAVSALILIGVDRTAVESTGSMGPDTDRFDAP
jgi:MFS family permease